MVSVYLATFYLVKNVKNISFVKTKRKIAMKFESYEDLMNADYRIYRMCRPSDYYGNTVYSYIASPSPIVAVTAFKKKFNRKPDAFSMIPADKTVYDSWTKSFVLLVADRDGSCYENRQVAKLPRALPPYTIV